MSKTDRRTQIKSLSPRIATLNTAAVRNATVAQDMRLTGARWRKARHQVLVEAKWLCQCADCSASGRVRIAHEVDHVVPVWEGGGDERTNLQAINRDCHARKTAAEAARRAAG